MNKDKLYNPELWELAGKIANELDITVYNPQHVIYDVLLKEMEFPTYCACGRPYLEKHVH